MSEAQKVAVKDALEWLHEAICMCDAAGLKTGIRPVLWADRVEVVVCGIRFVNGGFLPGDDDDGATG